MSQNMNFNCINLSDTEQAGHQIARILTMPSCVYLTGELGVGKTTLSKSIIEGLGYAGPVTSPTYNLIQEYPVATGTIYHMDLYRLDSPVELEFLALQDLWSQDSLFLVEWPERGQGMLQAPTHQILMQNSIKESTDFRKIVFKKLTGHKYDKPVGTAIK